MAFQRNNHYVPCLYLKRFSAHSELVPTYRLLVAHDNVPFWREKSLKGVAFHAHLYTRIAAGGQTDEIERWLNSEFESPAEEPLLKATTGARLSPADWEILVRFLAAQDVRTPARLAENLQFWNESLQGMLDHTLQRALQQLEAAQKTGKPIRTTETPNADYIPLRITRETEPGQEFGKLQVETLVGRGLWFFTMQRALTSTLNILHTHRWTILMPPDGMTWFTTDDPVVRLNYYGSQKYDFKGGWGNPGTEIFLPLDPWHLLYTKVGERPPRRGSVVPLATALMMRRFIAEHAHRFIFSATTDSDVPKLRPRKVDAALLRNEDQQWRRWHEEQSLAEQELRRSSGKKH
jgi:hypothetical protein